MAVISYPGVDVLHDHGELDVGEGSAVRPDSQDLFLNFFVGILGLRIFISIQRSADVQLDVELAQVRVLLLAVDVQGLKGLGAVQDNLVGEINSPRKPVIPKRTCEFGGNVRFARRA